ncbi:MAG: hypothetical protein WC648_04630 [Candidatus Paceibacterota bacterium]|jgi:hypothetical protein
MSEHEKVTQKDLYDTINDFRREVNTRFDSLERHFVTHVEFEPVKKVVNGIVSVGGLILMAILGLVLSQVIPGFNL